MKKLTLTGSTLAVHGVMTCLAKTIGGEETYLPYLNIHTLYDKWLTGKEKDGKPIMAFRAQVPGHIPGYPMNLYPYLYDLKAEIVFDDLTYGHGSVKWDWLFLHVQGAQKVSMKMDFRFIRLGDNSSQLLKEDRKFVSCEVKD